VKEGFNLGENTSIKAQIIRKNGISPIGILVFCCVNGKEASTLLAVYPAFCLGPDAAQLKSLCQRSRPLEPSGPYAGLEKSDSKGDQNCPAIWLSRVEEKKWRLRCIQRWFSASEAGLVLVFHLLSLVCHIFSYSLVGLEENIAYKENAAIPRTVSRMV